VCDESGAGREGVPGRRGAANGTCFLKPPIYVIPRK